MRVFSFNIGSRTINCSTNAMACSQRVPPKFVSEDDYENWRRDVEVWCQLTDLDKSKQALSIHLQLTGRARIASCEIENSELAYRELGKYSTG